MLTYIHTVQVGGFLHSQHGLGGLSSGSSERSKRYCLKLYILWPAKETLAFSNFAFYKRFSLKRPLNFLFLACGCVTLWLECVRKKERVTSSLSLCSCSSLARWPCLTSQRLVDKKQGGGLFFFWGGAPESCWNDAFKLQGSWIPRRWEWRV